MAFSHMLCHVIGYVGQEPEIKKLDSGDVVSFSVAVSERWKDRRGEDMEHDVAEGGGLVHSFSGSCRKREKAVRNRPPRWPSLAR